MGSSAAVVKILEPRPSALGYAINEMTAAYPSGFQQTLASQSKEIAVKRAAINAQTEPDPQLIGRIKFVVSSKFSQYLALCHNPIGQRQMRLL
jgi:hypothetical protein